MAAEDCINATPAQEEAWLRWERERFEGVGVVEFPRPLRERLLVALKELRDVAEEIQYGLRPVEEERLARAVLNASTLINEAEGRG